MSAKRIVLAEYFTTDELTLLFGVRADWDAPKVVEIPVSMTQIRQYVGEMFGRGRSGDGEGQEQQSSEVLLGLDLDLWQERFAPFVEPIRDWAAPGDYLYLVPHDMLHYVPLHALKVEGAYLAERNSVLYTPSASVLKYCQAKRKGRREKALVLGDSHGDLLHARAEAIAVAQAFHTNPYLCEQAQKSVVQTALKEEGGEIDILHFALHGYFHPHQPLKSGLLMALESENQHDDQDASQEKTPQGLPLKWFLTAEEWFGMEMHADLVTLSACDTAASEIKPGDELFGLMRALIYAGTPSVVMSLWSVDQVSCSILMQKFYESLKAGRTKVEALQFAQLCVKEITASQAIDYCRQAQDLLIQYGQQDSVQTLKKNIADLHYQARNFELAGGLYEELVNDVAPGGASSQLAAAITRSHRLAERGLPVDYDKQVYTHPFHWAPFILVGDWQ